VQSKEPTGPRLSPIRKNAETLPKGNALLFATTLAFGRSVFLGYCLKYPIQFSG
jgi:hypothetical protein